MDSKAENLGQLSFIDYCLLSRHRATIIAHIISFDR